MNVDLKDLLDRIHDPIEYSRLLAKKIDELEALVSILQEFNSNLVTTVDIEQPVGFKTPSDVSISIDDSQRKLFVSGDFTYFNLGVKFTSTGTKEVQWPNIGGIHFFYFNDDGILSTTNVFTENLITRWTIVSILYWDDVASKHIYWGDERHGIQMNTRTHLYLHLTRGAAFDRGCNLLGFLADGNGSSNAHAQFTAGIGTIWDEDIKISLPAQATIPILYRSGTVWKRKEADSFPVIYNGTAGYTGTRIPYNRQINGSWDLAEVGSNKFVLVHIFATNDIEFPYLGVQGQVEYNDKTSARSGAVTELQTISGLPVAEFCPVGSVIFQTASGYTNTPKALIVSVNGSAYEDHRAESLRLGVLA